jgi:hypothetical protein
MSVSNKPLKQMVEDTREEIHLLMNTDFVPVRSKEDIIKKAIKSKSQLAKN